jgi:copper resistance protein D
MDQALVVGFRLLQYAGVAALLGAPLFLLSAGRALKPGAWVRPVLAAAAAATFVGAVGALIAQTAVMAGSWTAALDPESLSVIALHTPLGQSMGLRAAVGAAAMVLCLVAEPRRIGLILLTAAGAVMAVSFPWSGHAGSGEGPGTTWHIAADAVHAVAAAIWLGALLALTLSIRATGAGRDPAMPAAFLGFSRTGAIAVIALAATGLVNAAFLIGPEHVGDLSGGVYGRLLLIKLALFAGMLALAASNRFRLTPALVAAQATGDPEPALRRLKASVTLETLLGAALLAVVAVMGVEPPPARG